MNPIEQQLSLIAAHIGPRANVLLTKDLTLVKPSTWQTLIFALFGHFECFRRYYFSSSTEALQSLKVTIARNPDRSDRLVKLFNDTLTNYYTSVVRVTDPVLPCQEQATDPVLTWQEQLRQDVNSGICEVRLRHPTSEKVAMLLGHKDRIKILDLYDTKGVDLSSLSQLHLTQLYINNKEVDPQLLDLIPRLDLSQMKEIIVSGLPHLDEDQQNALPGDEDSSGYYENGDVASWMMKQGEL